MIKSFSDAIDMVRYGVGKVVNLKLFTGDGSMEIPKFFFRKRYVRQKRIYGAWKRR